MKRSTRWAATKFIFRFWVSIMLATEQERFAGLGHFAEMCDRIAKDERTNL